MSALAIASIPVSSVREQSKATSASAQTLCDLWVAAVAHRRNHASDWRPLTNALIEDIAKECGQQNWDGYGADAVSERAAAYAQAFVELLPYLTPPPEPTAAPHGEIALTWDFGRGYVFSVIFGESATINYAGLLGRGVRRHGVEPFEGYVPKTILESLEELRERAPAQSASRGR